jgi:hypothetical protein
MGHVRPVTLVRDHLAARAQTRDQGVEAVHAWVESYCSPVSVEPIGAQPGILVQVCHLRLTHGSVARNLPPTQPALLIFPHHRNEGAISLPPAGCVGQGPRGGGLVNASVASKWSHEGNTR